MNEYIQNNKRSLILLTGLFFILAIVLYFMLVRPVGQELKTTEDNIQTAHHTIDDLNRKMQLLEMESEEPFDVDQLLNEKTIPSTRELDEYILSLQQLELTTSSHIEQINFVYDSQISDHEDPSEEDEETAESSEATDTEDLDEPKVEANPTEESVEEDDEADADESEEETAEQAEPTIDPAIIYEKPENLQVMTVRVNGFSPDFDEFVELLEAIEQEDRLSIVSRLSFDRPTEQELEFAEEETTEIPFEIELTTFYYES